MSGADTVWIIDDDTSIRWVLSKALEAVGRGTREFPDASRVLESLGRERPAAIVTDIRMPGMSGFELLEQLTETAPGIPVIITTAYANLDSAVSAFQGGAFEYLPKPFDVDDAVELVERAIRQSRKAASEEPLEAIDPRPAEIIGAAGAMQEVFRAIGRLSKASINVLITGESGTGKELVARALHRHSPRADGPFIALNMAAINRELLESELFGHEKGAFTGAQSARPGRFEQADRGTLFLDEIGDMPPELQTRLLRVLAEREFYRLGGHAPKRVDVRIIAATHQSLEDRVVAGEFREDLFHRLNVVRVRLPALRERHEDIPALLQHFLGRAATELQVDRKTITAEAERKLVAFGWPGNVRQLENMARWLTVMTPTQTVHVDDLPPELLENTAAEAADAPEGASWEVGLRRWAARELRTGATAVMHHAQPTFERIMIAAALERTAGKRQEAAALLGWGRNTLTRKIKELGIENGS